MAYGAKADRETIEERDKRMEKRYDFDRQGERSMLAYVSVHSPELAKMFLDWFADEHRHMEPPEDGLIRWEVVRFGSALEEAGHGMLWFVVRRMIRGEWPMPKAQSVKLTPGLAPSERYRRFMAAVDELVKGHGI